MRISVRRVGDAVVLDLHGALAGHKAVAMLESAVRRHCREGVRDMVANLGGVPSVDLAGLGALVDAQGALGQMNGGFKLACIASRMHDLVVITRLLTVFDTYDSVEEALGETSLAPAGATSPQISEVPFGAIQRLLRRV